MHTRIKEETAGTAQGVPLCDMSACLCDMGLGGLGFRVNRCVYGMVVRGKGLSKAATVQRLWKQCHKPQETTGACVWCLFVIPLAALTAG